MFKFDHTFSYSDVQMTNKKLTHDIIVKALVDALEPLSFVHAFWEGGAISFNRVDEWSDLDVYAVVDDDKHQEAFQAVEKALKSLSPIKQKLEVNHPPATGIFQAFYRLENASEYLLVDLAVLKLSSPDKFLEPEIHGKAIFHFNKSNKIKVPSIDKDAFVKKLHDALKRLQDRFDMFGNFVQKEIYRGNYLDAIGMYHALVLTSLVEALRIKHNPVHHDFRLRYIDYELPSEVIEKLKWFYLIQNESDIQKKYDEAVKWFHEVMSGIDFREVERQVRMS